MSTLFTVPCLRMRMVFVVSGDVAILLGKIFGYPSHMIRSEPFFLFCCIHTLECLEFNDKTKKKKATLGMFKILFNNTKFFIKNLNLKIMHFNLMFIKV